MRSVEDLLPGLNDRLNASATAWKDFFSSLIWKDIQMLLNSSKDQGIEELREVSTQGPLLDNVRGKLEVIDEILKLPESIDHWLEEDSEPEPEERTDPDEYPE